jgi:hypothetical protein
VGFFVPGIQPSKSPIGQQYSIKITPDVRAFNLNPHKFRDIAQHKTLSRRRIMTVFVIKLQLGQRVNFDVVFYTACIRAAVATVGVYKLLRYGIQGCC